MKYLRKALTAGAFALAGAVGAAMLDGRLSGVELLAAAGAGLVAGAGTWRVPNAEHPPGLPRSAGRRHRRA